MRAVLLGQGPLRDAVAADLRALEAEIVAEGSVAELLVTITSPVAPDTLCAPDTLVWSEAACWLGRIAVSAASFHARAPDPVRDESGECLASAQILHVIDEAPGLAASRHASQAVAAAGLIAMTRMAALQMAPKLRVNAIVPARPSAGMRDEIRPEALDVQFDPIPGRLIETLRFAISTSALTGEILSVPLDLRD
ncbi:hypothetical protein [Palleronia sp. LCG004]|uniref:hypothetical protein n=1 Tax=Palleronia sp. LCG004 TaxID=3079304 RepID=UPI0029435CC8|nr:hypothetical protein [Palleronia sp. LCG004]WOI56059.1 hypothetical protein RVY76_13610 [Palleronia sp. LCG004]